MLIGYARVSTEDQSLNLQVDALRKAGCERIYQDMASGALSARPGLDDALRTLHAGDCLVVWRLDRLGRSVKHLVLLAETLKSRDVDFRCLQEGIDTTSPTGRFFFHVMSAFAELEREVIRERTKAGLSAARARGRIGGRPRRMTLDKVEAAETLHASGLPVKDIAHTLEVSVATVYRYLSVAENREGHLAK